jgi:GDP-L-fucose synthase
MDSRARIYVAGRTTFVGAALVRRLEAAGFTGIVADDPDVTDRADIERFFERTRPEYVFVAAGRTAGIEGNQRSPADLMADNLAVASSLIPAAWRTGVRKLQYLASSCIYPKLAPQPLHPSSLWTGPLEPTSAAYAVAKLAGVTLCDAYRQQYGVPFFSAVAADVYGPGNDFSPERSHVVGALVRRIHEAKCSNAPSVDVWGSGEPRREFVYVDDLADASIFAMQKYDGGAPINLGTGIYTRIADLARLVRDVVGYRGDLRYDRTRPDGMPFKGLDSTSLRDLGWTPAWTLGDGLRRTYDSFLAQSQPASYGGSA